MTNPRMRLPPYVVCHEGSKEDLGGGTILTKYPFGSLKQYKMYPVISKFGG